MRNFIKIVEQADADNMYGSIKTTVFGRQNGQEFSDPGRGNVRQRPGTDARFGDNPMDDKQLDEFVDTGMSGDPTKLERLRKELEGIGIDKQTIMQSPQIPITDESKQRLAASFGVSSDVIDLMYSSLVQKLRDDDSHSTDAIIDSYYTTMGEGADAPIVCKPVRERSSKAFKPFEKKKADKKPVKKDTKRPFDSGVMVERFTYERDAIGNVTVRDTKTGKERFFRGTRATTIFDQLKKNKDHDAVLGPLMEFHGGGGKNIEAEKSYMDEIRSPVGLFNFMWRYGARHGTATADGSKQPFDLIEVRDMNGDEVPDVDHKMRTDLMQQAEDFIRKDIEQ